MALEIILDQAEASTVLPLHSRQAVEVASA